MSDGKRLLLQINSNLKELEVFKDEDLEEAFNWKNSQLLLKEVHQRKQNFNPSL